MDQYTILTAAALQVEHLRMELEASAQQTREAKVLVEETIWSGEERLKAELSAAEDRANTQVSELVRSHSREMQAASANLSVAQEQNKAQILNLENQVGVSRDLQVPSDAFWILFCTHAQTHA